MALILSRSLYLFWRSASWERRSSISRWRAESPRGAGGEEVVEVGDLGVELLDLLAGHFEIMLGLGELFEGLLVGGLKAFVLIHGDAAAEAGEEGEDQEEPEGDCPCEPGR